MSAPTGEVLRASDAVLSRIVSGAYPAGLRLPAESELAAELGMSRGTLREALRHLAGLGVVRSRRGSGVLVLDFRREGTLALLPPYIAAGRFDRPLGAVVAELLHMRTTLASEAARLAATYATPESLADARRRMRELDALASDPTAHALAELELFRALVHASAIWPAVWLANSFWGPMRELHERFAAMVAHVPKGYGKTLEEVFARIDRKDAAGASALIREHFEKVDKTIGGRLDRLLGSPKEAAS